VGNVFDDQNIQFLNHERSRIVILRPATAEMPGVRLRGNPKDPSL
jgi:hypothetical protein